MFAPGTIQRLLEGVGGEDPEGTGNTGLQGNLLQTPSRLPGHVLEVGSLPTNHGAETYNSVELSRVREPSRRKWQLEGTRCPDDLDVIGDDAELPERRQGALYQLLRYNAIEA